MPASWFRNLLLLVISSLLLTIPASAHDLDLGGSKWCIGKNRILATIELGSSLFPEIRGVKEGGYDLAAITDGQLRQMATGAIQPYLDERLSVSVNDRPYPARVDRLEREGTLWKIWLEVSDISFDRQDSQVKIDYRLLFEETGNGHVNVGFLYFSEAEAESVQKIFDYNHPDLQNTFEFNQTAWEFSVKGTAAESTETTYWSSIVAFLALGIEHILTGYDHIAFLIALIVIGLSIREVLKIITAFTVAHSVTLLLAALQVVSPDSRFVEIVIALSICCVALENLLAKQVQYRWLLTFAFGLIHGFGFASALQEFIAGKSNLVLSVVSFNVGVEIGQLMIFVMMLPVLHLLRNKFESRRVTAGASVAIFIIGLAWLVERVFNLQLVSF